MPTHLRYLGLDVHAGTIRPCRRTGPNGSPPPRDPNRAEAVAKLLQMLGPATTSGCATRPGPVAGALLAAGDPRIAR